MAAFVLRRLFWTIPVVLLVILLTFVLMSAIPGNPFRRTERAVPPAVQANLERKFNLDKPYPVRYVLYVKGVFCGKRVEIFGVVPFCAPDLGPSLVLRGREVTGIVADHFPKSLQLGLLAFAWAIVIGIPAGILAALRPNSPFDYFAMFFSNVGFALPNFFVGTILIYFLALQLGWVPTNGWVTWKHKILPSFALGLFPMAYFARLVRGTMLETMQQDYVRTAKAKGLRWRRIVGLHVFRNSLIPVVTATAPLLGLIITGTFVIEFLFSVPGIGRYFITAVQARDYSVVMGITVLTSLIIVLANLFVDIAYGFLDPRTREART